MTKRKKNLVKSIFGAAVVITLIVTAASCNDNKDENDLKTTYGDANIPEAVVASDSVSGCVVDCLNSLPVEELSDLEKEHLQFMREEEYLARDVYIYMYDLYNLPVFNNISKAEQFHTSAIKILLDKYNLEDPGENHTAGVFQNETLQTIYNDLIESGNQSLTDALVVGATIEDLDINDLEECLADVDNEDITLVFSNLTKGSRNHLRAFTRHLTIQNMSYTPQYISQDEYDEIVNSSWEIGNGICMYCINN